MEHDRDASVGGVVTRLDGGILGERTEKNLTNLLLKLGVDQFEAVYRDTHDGWYAEPEFAGHYVRAAIAGARHRDVSELLDRAQRVTGWMSRYQRGDGYLGTYRPGLEFDDSFSIWNQQFSIMALLDIFDETGEREALETARRCADYIATSYRAPDSPLRILHAINQGIENTCILIEYVRLAETTGDDRYLEFAEWIVDTWEASHLRLVSATEGDFHSGWGSAVPSTVRLGGPKAIESLICYRGLLRLGRLTANDRYVRAARTHWEELAVRQIGATGNGSMGELWPLHGHRAMPIPTELHPNENCVAVGWMELSMDLFDIDLDGRYLDEFERTLYNHLLGSQAFDGSDFSYYQGNLGRKVHTSSQKQYSCCRYRGMSMLAHLEEYVVRSTAEGPAVLLYTPSTSSFVVDGVGVSLRQETSYPRDGRVRLEVDPDVAVRFPLRLRRPSTATRFSVRVGDGVSDDSQPVDRGFIVLDREWRPGDVVQIDIEFATTRQTTEVGDDRLALTTFGPLVLAADTRENDDLSTLRAGEGAPELVAEHPDDWSRIVRFASQGDAITYVDYASAGSLDPGSDRFATWIRAREEPTA